MPPINERFREPIRGALFDVDPAATDAEALPALASFHEFAAVINSCDLLLTPDTSVVHLAAA